MAIDERRTGREGIASIHGGSLEENEIRLRISELMEFEAQSKAILRDWIPETRLNGGAFAHVFRMRNRETRQRAALKFIPIPFKRDECVADPEFFKGEFDEQKREVELLAQFREYPYIIQMIGEPEFLTVSIRKNGQKVIRYAVLFLMPLLNAKDVWRPQLKDSIPDRLRLCIQISTALIAFNEKKIRHRDIKPENILMDEHGDFYLTDLGQAKKGNQTTTFRTRGTEGYIAPEVYRTWERDEAFDHRADIYSLGIVMYELFNWGQKPFLEKDGTLSQDSIRAYHSIHGKRRINPPASECAIQLRYSGKVKLPPPGEADSELAPIILKACAYEAKDRYKNAEALLDALEAYRERHPECAGGGTLRVQPVQAVPPVPDHGGKKGRKSVPVVLAILAFAGICVGVWILTPGSEPDERELLTPVPTIELTATPTVEPMIEPTVEPTAEPTAAPTAELTATPTVEPTAELTATPTIEPTAEPTATSTAEPASELPLDSQLDASLDRVPVTVGMTVSFGQYEQDAEEENGREPIAWKVLDVQDGKALLITQYALDLMPFSPEADGQTEQWEACGLRSWLNHTFYHTAFDRDEKAAIVSTRLEKTQDVVFILSRDEVERYLPENEDRIAQPTQAACRRNREISKKRAAWWLRDDSGKTSYAVMVKDSGHIITRSTKSTQTAFRPAIWVDLSAIAGISGGEDHLLIPRSTGESEETAPSFEIGSTLFMGEYEQNGDLTDGRERIEWQVIDRDGDCALLLSKYVIDSMPFNTAGDNSRWGYSTVRTYLNGPFVTDCFTEEERSRIIEVSHTCTNSDGDFKSDTTDRVFLLSAEELEKAFPEKADRLADPTYYAFDNGNSIYYTTWWLRSAMGARYIAIVDGEGRDDYWSYYMNLVSGVRPAMWVDIAAFSPHSLGGDRKDGEFFGKAVGMNGNQIVASLSIEGGRITACAIQDDMSTDKMKEGYDMAAGAVIGMEVSDITSQTSSELLKVVEEFGRSNKTILTTSGEDRFSAMNALSAIKRCADFLTTGRLRH